MNTMKWQLVILTIICVVLIWLVVLNLITMFTIDITIAIIGIIISTVLSSVMMILLWKKPSIKTINRYVKDYYIKKTQDD